MTLERVAQLLVRAMATTHTSWIGRWLLYEVWIAKAAALVYAYMSHYTPTIFRFMNHLVGLARMEAWTVNQMDMLELPSLIQTLPGVCMSLSFSQPIAYGYHSVIPTYEFYATKMWYFHSSKVELW